MKNCWLLGLVLCGCATVEGPIPQSTSSHARSAAGTSESRLGEIASQPANPQATGPAAEVLKNRSDSARALNNGMKDVNTAIGGH